jgi:hypothetical protein
MYITSFCCFSFGWFGIFDIAVSNDIEYATSFWS